MRFINDEYFQQIARLVVEAGLSYHSYSQLHDVTGLFQNNSAKGINQFVREQRLRQHFSTMKNNTIRKLRDHFQKYYPDTAIFFVGETPELDAAREQYAEIVTYEAIIVNPITNVERAISGKVYDIGIDLTVIRRGVPVHGICTFPMAGLTYLTYNGHSLLFRHKSNIAPKGKFEEYALTIRGIFKKFGFPEELRQVRHDDFFEEPDEIRFSHPDNPPASQILMIASAYADKSDLLNSRLNAIGAADAVLINAGGKVLTDGNIPVDYKFPWMPVTCYADGTLAPEEDENPVPAPTA